MINNISYSIIVFALLVSLFSCRINVAALNQKTIQKCKECRKFLKEIEPISAPLRSYNRRLDMGDWEPLIKNLPDSLKKDNIIMRKEINYIYERQFCFLGMKKHDILSRFDPTLKKMLDERPDYNIPWAVTITTHVGEYRQDSLLWSIASYDAFKFEFKIIGRDTICYKAGSGDSKKDLIKCLEAEGVKYSD